MKCFLRWPYVPVVHLSKLVSGLINCIENEFSKYLKFFNTDMTHYSQRKNNVIVIQIQLHIEMF
jgi:hypothetical protein